MTAGGMLFVLLATGTAVAFAAMLAYLSWEYRKGRDG